MRRSLPVVLLLCLLTPPVEAAPPATLVAHVTVREPGDYVIAAADLQTLGIRSPAYAEVRLFGRVVAPCPGESTDLFLRVPRSDNRSSGLTTYQLWRRTTPRPIVPARMEVNASLAGRTVLDRDRVYGELAAADPDIYAAPDLPVWFLAAVSPTRPATIQLAPRGSDPRASHVLGVTVYAAHRGTVALQATWGGRDLGIARVQHAVGGAALRWMLPPSAVPGEAQPLTLVDRSPRPPPAPARDVSNGRRTVYIDELSLTGIDTTPPSSTWSLGARRVTPRPVSAVVDPLVTAGRAEHVILATPPLVEAAHRLARHRTKTGIPSVVVPLADVYDGPYGFGNRSPAAIVRFIDALRSRPGIPLRYVLLAGDATFDRTDFGADITLPTPMARTMYNGATSADRLYVLPPKGATGGASIGRLPFRTAEEMQSYVERVIRYESTPPAHPARRLLRFVTSEGRFGTFIDNMMERQFRSILAKDVPPAFDVEVTFASETSPFLWPPPEFNQKVIDGLNEGALFYTYVGHGFAQGFDTLRVGGARHPILHLKDAPKLRVHGTPPIVLVLACTTAMFDGTASDGVGEALLKQPEGPVAYWGATRVCHPIYNTWIGQALARRIASGPPLDRLGDILDAARDHVLEHPPAGAVGLLLKNFAGVQDMNRLMREGALMYTLLGDPALKVALPRADLQVRASVEGEQVAVEVQGPLPEGVTLHVSLELPRNRSVETPTPVATPQDPATFPQIRKIHARMNDWALERVEGRLRNGRWAGSLALGGRAPKGLIVKAWAVTSEDVHQGAVRLP